MATKKKAASKAKTKTTRKESASKKRTASSPTSSRKQRSAKDDVITLDRRRKARRVEDAGPVDPEETGDANQKVVAPTTERRQKVQRRRQIDPTTCERDYSDAEVEFMNAMDEYKRTSGRMFPTCSEVLEVIGALGYVQLTSAELTALGRAPFEDGDATVESNTFDADEVDAAEVDADDREAAAL